MPSFSDEQLVKQCKAGSQQHWRLLFERYKNYVSYLAWNMVGDAEMSRDITQETFLRAVRGIKKFKGKSSFKTWLTRIVVNLCKDHFKGVQTRHEKLHVPLGDPEEGGIGEIPTQDPSFDPERQVLQKELGAVLDAAMNKLSKEHKTTILLSNEGFSYDEIAEITKTSKKTVGSRIFYAKMSLRKILRPYMKGTGR